MLSDFLPFALSNRLSGDEHMHLLCTGGAQDVEVMSILWSTHSVVFVCSLTHYPATVQTVRGMLFFSPAIWNNKHQGKPDQTFTFIFCQALEKFILIIICQSLRSLTLASFCSAQFALTKDGEESLGSLDRHGEQRAGVLPFVRQGRVADTDAQLVPRRSHQLDSVVPQSWKTTTEKLKLLLDPASEQSVGCCRRGFTKVPGETRPWNIGVWTQLSMQSSLFSLWNKVETLSKVLRGVLSNF